MASHLPPIPPEGRSDKGPAQQSSASGRTVKEKPPINLAEQGQQGNIKQNTTHQGHQQDR